jgi:hypothetical protein
MWRVMRSSTDAVITAAPWPGGPVAGGPWPGGPAARGPVAPWPGGRAASLRGSDSTSVGARRRVSARRPVCPHRRRDKYVQITSRPVRTAAPGGPGAGVQGPEGDAERAAEAQGGTRRGSPGGGRRKAAVAGLRRGRDDAAVPGRRPPEGGPGDLALGSFIRISRDGYYPRVVSWVSFCNRLCGRARRSSRSSPAPLVT